MSTARRMWWLLEPLHAVVYFAPEVADALRGVGLRGFWMGYFAGRAAPLGAVGPGPVAAAFFNFHPSMVARALPDAWSHASPDAVVAARTAAVEEALARVLGPLVASVPVAEAAELAEQACSGADPAGRVLFGAHLDLARPASPLGRLWHAATLLREHRGDGHVAANLIHGFDGVASHVAFVATGTVERATVQPHRGWSDDEWTDAVERLGAAGLLDASDRLTDAGLARRRAVEHDTDRLASGPWRHLGDERTERLADLLEPLAAAVAASGALPFPNPMGLPPPDGGPP